MVHRSKRLYLLQQNKDYRIPNPCQKNKEKVKECLEVRLINVTDYFKPLNLKQLYI